MSYISILLHIIFRTKRSEKTIPEESKSQMFKYFQSACDDLGVKLVKINGYKNHLHLLVSVEQEFAVSEFVKRVKQGSSKAFNRTPIFPKFDGWAKGYAAFSVSYYESDKIKNYIDNQTEHHKTVSFQEEIEKIFSCHCINGQYFLND